MVAPHNQKMNDAVGKAGDQAHQSSNETTNKWSEKAEKDTYGQEAEKQLHQEHVIDAKSAHEKLTPDGQLDCGADIYHNTGNTLHVASEKSATTNSCEVFDTAVKPEHAITNYQQMEKQEHEQLLHTAMIHTTSHTYGIRTGYGSDSNFRTAIAGWRSDKGNYENETLKKILLAGQRINRTFS